ncbi:hypothetical protein ACFU5Y_29505 [Streptomyces gardneri]|uniref:hypothetical protein n=1 Tax=Streptomyces gardneri TaxID=66892 RepID=UPI0036A063CD
MAEITRTAHVSCVKEILPSVRSEAAQYRSRIAEMWGFERARCASDADRCWSSGPAMRDNDLEAMCSKPVKRAPHQRAARLTMSWFQEGEQAWRP